MHQSKTFGLTTNQPKAILGWVKDVGIALTLAAWMAPVIRPSEQNIGYGDILGVFMAIWCAVSLGTVQPSGWRRLGLWYGAGGLFVAGLSLSVAGASGNVAETAQAILQYCYVFLLIPLVISGTVRWQVLLVGVTLGVLANVIVALYFWKIGFAPGSIWGKGGRLAGFMANPNALGKILAEASIVFLFIASGGGWRRGVWGWFGYGLTLIGVLLSASFGALLAFFIGMAGFLILARRWKLMLTLIVVAAILGGALVTVFKESGLTAIFDRRIGENIGGVDLRSLGSLDYKLYRMSIAVDKVMQSPFIGTGAQSDVDISAFETKAHNWPLVMGEEAGLIGMLGVFVVFLFAAAGGLRANKMRSPHVQALGVTYFVVFIVNAMTNTQMYGRHWWVIFSVVLVGIYSHSAERWVNKA